MAEVSFADVEKVYENGARAVRSLTLDIADGEFLVLVGPSGCGKTTALRMVAGLEDISDGTISIGGRVVNDIRSKERDVAMVFQNYALYPHLSVKDNITFGLRLRKTPKAVVDERLAWAASMLGLTPYLDRKPRQLSGGQRQRVAMGRAIVRQPQVFLMDEPLSNLDAKLRVQMRAEIAQLQRQVGTTTIYVTHDQVEAMTMGDRVAVMSNGVLQQVDAPERLFDRPENLFVAGFIGTPPMSLLEVPVKVAESVIVTIGHNAIPLGPQALANYPRVRAYDGRTVILGIRAGSLRAAADSGLPTIPARVARAEFLGEESIVYFDVDAHTIRGDVSDPDSPSEAAAVGVAANLVGSFPAGTRFDVGTNVLVGVDSAALHFFDPTTGLPLR